MYPHAIRLRGPWQCQRIHDGGAASEPATVSLPCAWHSLQIAGERSRVRLQRAFNKPSNLDPHERLWLVCEPTGARGVIQCNGHTLGSVPEDQPGQWEITPYLTGRNEVVLQLVVPPSVDSQPMLGDVRLEIRERQFLANCTVRVESIGSQALLCIEGMVAGEPSDVPLEFIVRGPEEELLYAEVAAGDRFSFHVASDLPLPKLLNLRLLRGGTRIWQGDASVDGNMDSLRD